MKKQSKGNAKLVIIIICLILLVSMVGLTFGFFIFAKKYLEGKYPQSQLESESESSTSSDNYERQKIKDVPVYLGSTVKSFTDENGQQSVTYTTPVGVSDRQVLAFYDLKMPAYNWTKTTSNGSRSRTYQHSDGRQAEVWIFYSNPSEGTDYVVECPPFTGHPSSGSQ